MEPQRPKKLLDQVRDVIRRKHYSRRTEDAYISWIRRYILFHNKRLPREMGTPEIQAFLTHLAVNLNVAASTQNQALSALIFLYRDVLNQELQGTIDAVRAKKPQRLPTVLTNGEVRRVMAHLEGIPHLVVTCSMAVDSSSSNASACVERHRHRPPRTHNSQWKRHKRPIELTVTLSTNLPRLAKSLFLNFCKLCAQRKYMVPSSLNRFNTLI